jgi:hypothetical protein
MAQNPLPLYLKERSNSPRKSERIPEYRLTSKKPGVVCAEKPRDLPGVHADLMEKAIAGEEELLYLVYSPICQERDGPFGLKATPASHAVGITKYRFIISEDRHLKGIPPTVQSVPFNQMFSVELGNALFFGWLSIQFVVDEKRFCKTFFFPATTGMKHFGIAVSQYRRMTRPTHDLLPSKKIDWRDIWRHTPKTETDHLRPLILQEELPFNMLRSSEQWILRKRKRKNIPTYLSTNGILVSTNFGLIRATEEPFTKPEIFGFGVSASCIAFDGLKSTHLHEKSMNGTRLCFLQLKLARGNVTVGFDISFDGSSLKDAENLVHVLAQEVLSR